MTKSIPMIQKYMSTDVQTIGDDQTMLMAHRLMREGRIRHLPVLHQGKLVGIVSDRDLNLVESLSNVDPKLVTVSEAMTGDPYVVAPETPLDEVVSMMAEKKYGSAVVCDNHKVVGIFTTVDACTALATLLSTRLAS
jgi:acetoin utilization protein AcuB